MGREMGLTFVALVGLCAVSTSAFGADDDVEAEAIACFQAGKSLYRQEQFTEAAAKFREAYELKPSWKLFYNIAQSEASAKRHGLALEAFERFLSEGGDDVFETRRDQVLAEVERLRKIVGFLKVRAPGGTVVRVDGVVRGTAPVLMALPVAVGTQHELSGERDGQILKRQPFRVTGGQTVVITIVEDSAPIEEVETASSHDDNTTLESNATTSADSTVGKETSPSEERRSPFVTPGIVVLGTGAAAAVAGGVLGGIALSRNRTISDECDGFCPEYDGDERSIEKMGVASTALIAAGSTVLVAGAALLFVGKRQEKREASMLSFVPILHPNMVAASIEWRF